MSRRRPEKWSRRHVWLDDEDWEEITTLYGDTIGVSAAIRTMVRAFLVKVREEAARKSRPLPTTDLADFTSTLPPEDPS